MILFSHSLSRTHNHTNTHTHTHTDTHRETHVHTHSHIETHREIHTHTLKHKNHTHSGMREMMSLKLNSKIQKAHIGTSSRVFNLTIIST